MNTDNNYAVSERIVRDMQYARIIEAIAEELHTSREEAMDLFYSSPLFDLIEEGVADLNCRSDKYLANEIINWNKQNKAGEEVNG